MKSILSRRYFLESAAMLGLTLASTSTHAGVIKLPLPGGPGERPITTQFPQKGELILQRSGRRCWKRRSRFSTRAIFTPNDQFFVRWHWAGIPTESMSTNSV